MSILLLGFSNDDEAFPCEYQLTGADALRAAVACGHPVVKGVAVTCNVTFFHEGLTHENCNENLERARHAAAEAGDSLELFE